jgi:hypothetical protein
MIDEVNAGNCQTTMAGNRWMCKNSHNLQGLFDRMDPVVLTINKLSTGFVISTVVWIERHVEKVQWLFINLRL